MGSTIPLPNGMLAAPAATPRPATGEPQATGPVAAHQRRAVALFIGGAGDKKSYYLAGPYRNIAYALAAFDQRIEEAGAGDIVANLRDESIH